jgi:hypothetical protein
MMAATRKHERATVRGIRDADAAGWNDLDTRTPNPARMYDYLLGGVAKFAADRSAVRELLRTNPQARAQARANRAFLHRVVCHLVSEGVRQFLDLGSGMPTAEAAELVASYRDITAPGSWLALSHVCADDNPLLRAVEEQYRQTSLPYRSRHQPEIAALFDGYRLVEPGVVYIEDWRPDPAEPPDPAPPAVAGGLGRKE